MVLSIQHPLTQELLQFSAPYPKDLAAMLRQMRKYVAYAR
jgi:hypothetical protein